MKKFVEPFCVSGQIQCPEEGLQTRGLGILRRGAGFGHGVDMGVLAPAVEGQLLFRQVGQQLVHEGGLGGSFDHVDGVPVEIAYIFSAFGAEIAPAEDLKDTVAHVGKAQIGDGGDLLAG